jgi:hypothetical protein
MDHFIGEIADEAAAKAGQAGQVRQLVWLHQARRTARGAPGGGCAFPRALADDDVVAVDGDRGAGGDAHERIAAPALAALGAFQQEEVGVVRGEAGEHGDGRFGVGGMRAPTGTTEADSSKVRNSARGGNVSSNMGFPGFMKSSTGDVSAYRNTVFGKRQARDEKLCVRHGNPPVAARDKAADDRYCFIKQYPFSPPGGGSGALRHRKARRVAGIDFAGARG